MEIVKAPEDWMEFPRPWLFLGGAIAEGKADPWQAQVAEALKDEQGTILNPRRDAWDNSWEQSKTNLKFRTQVEWELDALHMSNTAIFYFQAGTKCPIALMEFGLVNSMIAEPTDLLCNSIVFCPEGFWRKGNVDIVCERMKIPMVSSWDALYQEVRADLQLARLAYRYGNEESAKIS